MTTRQPAHAEPGKRTVNCSTCFWPLPWSSFCWIFFSPCSLFLSSHISVLAPLEPLFQDSSQSVAQVFYLPGLFFLVLALVLASACAFSPKKCPVHFNRHYFSNSALPKYTTVWDDVDGSSHLHRNLLHRWELRKRINLKTAEEELELAMFWKTKLQIWLRTSANTADYFQKL